MNIKLIFFNEKALKDARKNMDPRFGLIGLILTSLIFVIPTDLEDVTLLSWFQNFLTVFILFSALIGLIFLLIVILEKKHPDFTEFFGVLNFAFGMSLLVISVPLFLIAEIVVNQLLNISVLSLVVFSLIPYYNYLLFGWICEKASKSSKIKAIVIAVISMTSIFLFHYFLRYIVT